MEEKKYVVFDRTILLKDNGEVIDNTEFNHVTENKLRLYDENLCRYFDGRYNRNNPTEVTQSEYQKILRKEVAAIEARERRKNMNRYNSIKSRSAAN